MHYKYTDFGFEWGAGKLERVFSDNKKGSVTMALKTPKYYRGIQIYITKTGKVRIHDENGEWIKPAKKDAKKDDYYNPAYSDAMNEKLK